MEMDPWASEAEILAWEVYPYALGVRPEAWKTDPWAPAVDFEALEAGPGASEADPLAVNTGRKRPIEAVGYSSLLEDKEAVQSADSAEARHVLKWEKTLVFAL